jgi:hypothetical protein
MRLLIALAMLAGLLFAGAVVVTVEPEPATVACVGPGC